MSRRILGLVPARGGSKGLPGKNLRPIAGRSPVERAWSVGAESGVLDRVIVSTEDPRILAHAVEQGLDAPFSRPPELARDDTPMIEVALHALDWLEGRGEIYEALLLLQPTSPLRREAHVREAVRLLRAHPSATAVCSVAPVPLELCPHYLMRVGEDGYLRPFMPDGNRYTRRQDVPRAHRRCGTVFLARAEVLRKERSFYGPACLPMPIDPDLAINIDGPDDWDEARRRLEAIESERRKSA